MTRDDILELFRETGVLQEGHFLLSSGNHSAQYLQCALVLQYPWHAEQLARILAEACRDLEVELVAAPAIGGIVFGHELARSLGVRSVFAERSEGDMRFRRGFQVRPGERVLVAEDVITTGGSVNEVIRQVQTASGQVVGVAAVVDRSGGSADFGVPFRSAIQLEVQYYPPSECPLCMQGLAVDKPGSRT